MTAKYGQINQGNARQILSFLCDHMRENLTKNMQFSSKRIEDIEYHLDIYMGVFRAVAEKNGGTLQVVFKSPKATVHIEKFKDL